MNTQAQKTVWYLNRKWVIDVETETLHPENDTRTKVNIDEVWEELSDNDRNRLAALLSEKTDQDIEKYQEDENEEEY